MAVDHPLAEKDELTIAELIDEPTFDFPSRIPCSATTGWAINHRGGHPPKIVAPFRSLADALLEAVRGRLEVNLIRERIVDTLGPRSGVVFRAVPGLEPAEIASPGAGQLQRTGERLRRGGPRRHKQGHRSHVSGRFTTPGCGGHIELVFHFCAISSHDRGRAALDPRRCHEEDRHRTPTRSRMNGSLATGARYDLSIRGAMVHADLDGKTARIVVGEGQESVVIEVAPTGPLPGDYFVGTFDGPRITALVQLSEDYELVQEIDMIHMVEAQREVSDFPRIAVVGEHGARRLVVLGGGAPTSLELHPSSAPVPQSAQ
jgi:hypothetical protein